MELRNLTVGIIGTGKIGSTVIQNLQGFGYKILANDAYENEAVKDLATYVDIDTLYRESDIISLHTPLLDSTYYMTCKDNLNKMKHGFIIIICARGELMSISDVLDGV